MIARTLTAHALQRLNERWPSLLEKHGTPEALIAAFNAGAKPYYQKGRRMPGTTAPKDHAERYKFDGARFIVIDGSIVTVLDHMAKHLRCGTIKQRTKTYPAQFKQKRMSELIQAGFDDEGIDVDIVEVLKKADEPMSMAELEVALDVTREGVRGIIRDAIRMVQIEAVQHKGRISYQPLGWVYERDIPAPEQKKPETPKKAQEPSKETKTMHTQAKPLWDRILAALPEGKALSSREIAVAIGENPAKTLVMTKLGTMVKSGAVTRIGEYGSYQYAQTVPVAASPTPNDVAQSPSSFDAERLCLVAEIDALKSENASHENAIKIAARQYEELELRFVLLKTATDEDGKTLRAERDALQARVDEANAWTNTDDAEITRLYDRIKELEAAMQAGADMLESAQESASIANHANARLVAEVEALKQVVGMTPTQVNAMAAALAVIGARG